MFSAAAKALPKIQITPNEYKEVSEKVVQVLRDQGPSTFHQIYTSLTLPESLKGILSKAQFKSQILKRMRLEGLIDPKPADLTPELEKSPTWAQTPPKKGKKARKGLDLKRECYRYHLYSREDAQKKELARLLLNELNQMNKEIRNTYPKPLRKADAVPPPELKALAAELELKTEFNRQRTLASIRFLDDLFEKEEYKLLPKSEKLIMAKEKGESVKLEDVKILLEEESKKE